MKSETIERMWDYSENKCLASAELAGSQLDVWYWQDGHTVSHRWSCDRRTGWQRHRRNGGGIMNALTYDQAIEAFHKDIEETRMLPPQPNRQLSEVRGSTWYLRNIDGPLARVNSKGEVRRKVVAS